MAHPRWWVNRIGQPRHFEVPHSQKHQLKKKKSRFSRPIIGIEGGGYMLASRANAKVDQGRAIIVNGLVRFLKHDPHPGYEQAAEYAGFAGRQSGYAGPQVVQFYRPKFEL